MEPKEFMVATPEGFEVVVEYLLSQTTTQPVSLVTLTGDLGAGKTTFTQQLAKHLGVGEHVTSPTFGIMKSYEITDHPQFDQLVHIDVYRIEDINETGPLRFAELFVDLRNLIVIEWPERIADILPSERIDVTIEIGKGELRQVSVAHVGG